MYLCISLGIIDLGFAEFLESVGWSLSFFGHFSVICPPAAAVSQKSCISRSLKTAVLSPAPVLHDHIKIVMISFSSVLTLGLGYTVILSFCPRPTNALVGHSYWLLTHTEHSPLTRVLLHHVASTTNWRFKKWFFFFLQFIWLFLIVSRSIGLPHPTISYSTAESV